MNDNLSAGPTLEELETDPETNNNDTDTTTDTDTETETGTHTWHCPYCNFTATELTGLRDHITDTIEGEHEGVSGWSPTRDIVATNPAGDEVRQIEGSGKRPDEDHHLDHGEKKKLIINAWVELDKERDIQAIKSIIPVSEQHVSNITKQLADGEIPPEEYRPHLDWDVRDELGERLDEYYDTQPSNTETAHMSLTATEEELERGAKKKQIINAWLLDQEISPAALDDVLEPGYQHIRRNVQKLNEGRIDKEEIENAASEELQSEIKAELEDAGVTVGTPTTEIPADISFGPDIPAEHQELYNNATKKARVLNSVLLEREQNVELSNSEISSAAKCSDQYVDRIKGNITNGDITEDELQEAADSDLQDALLGHYEHNDIITSDDTESIEQSDTVDIDLTVDVDDGGDPFENVDVSKKERLVNVFLFDPELSDADAGDLAGASGEYARQIHNGIQDGEYDVNEYQNESIQNALEQLEESGELAAFFADEEPSEQSDTEPEAVSETTDTTNTTDTTDSIDTTRTPGSGEAGKIPASEVERLRDTADLLLDQAEYEGEAGNPNTKAEFIARRLRDDLDELLETA
jgi:hypothetical protein